MATFYSGRFTNEASSSPGMSNSHQLITTCDTAQLPSNNPNMDLPMPINPSFVSTSGKRDADSPVQWKQIVVRASASAPSYSNNDNNNNNNNNSSSSSNNKKVETNGLENWSSSPQKRMNQASSKGAVSLDSEGRKQYSCTLCKFTTKKKGSLRVHLYSQHFQLQVYNCEQCDFVSTQKGNLQTHVRAVHEKLRAFPCHFCPYAAATKGILKTHVKNKHLKGNADNHKGGDHKCLFCHYKTAKKSLLKAHMISYHKDPY